METKFSVSLSKIISELELDVAYMPNEPETIHVSSKDITRPGLELTGFKKKKQMKKRKRRRRMNKQKKKGKNLMKILKIILKN
ncbi:MAG: hypothetical protein IIT39_15505 [Clostridia bacterium]|nr:hypothetical protein [Clostridia bacterium]